MNISDIFSLSGETLGLFKSATEVIKGLREITAADKPDRKQLVDSAIEALRDKMTELQDKHLALQAVAITAFQQNAQLTQDKRDLEEKLAKLNKFEGDRDLFEPVPFALGTSAYREKAFSGAADAQPLLCPNCFENSKKTYLSFHEHAMHTKHMQCTVCGTSVHIARNEGSQVMIARRGERKLDDW